MEMTRGTSGRIVRQAMHMLVGFVLLFLLAGVWACLWVRPSF